MRGNKTTRGLSLLETVKFIKWVNSQVLIASGWLHINFIEEGKIWRIWNLCAAARTATAAVSTWSRFGNKLVMAGLAIWTIHAVFPIEAPNKADLGLWMLWVGQLTKNKCRLWHWLNSMGNVAGRICKKSDPHEKSHQTKGYKIQWTLFSKATIHALSGNRIWFCV